MAIAIIDGRKVAITDEEAAENLNAYTIDPNVAIDAQIAALEATVTNRRLREAALTEAGKAWLADLDAQIAVLRAQRV